LAIIGSTLIDKEQLDAIRTIYKVMDTSGDGKIGTEEIAFGFKEILGVTLEEEELN
jgi:Ca2+-binding EF-hand superfamily protein